jgi:S-adenosylmethionine synthetase
MPYLFTSEAVSEGHPDKISDQISDAIVDNFLALDPESKVACETLVTTGLAVISGEVRSSGYVDVQQVAREVIRRIGYTKSEYKFDADSCGVISALHEQSEDINRGVEKSKNEFAEQGAGDQGMMFGYATSETDNLMPISLELSNLILRELSVIRREGKKMTYLRPDAKSQVTIRYNDNNHADAIDSIVVSTQHDEFDADDKRMLDQIKSDVFSILIPRVKAQLPERVSSLFTDAIKYHINPTGKFVIGGPHGDTGLTGRKIIVDTYGGKAPHGGGAFSGKDPSKVDRSAAYAMRHLAKNMVAAGLADEVLVQISYAIGVPHPIGLYVNTYGTSKVNFRDGELATRILKVCDFRPGAIVERLKLKAPIYSETAAYGHMGRKSEMKTFTFHPNGKTITTEAETFTWEKLDMIDQLAAIQ